MTLAQLGNGSILLSTMLARTAVPSAEGTSRLTGKVAVRL